jgi:hypothetical protein
MEIIMSNDWLDIQSFISDQEALRAINDLSIALQLSLAKMRDTCHDARTQSARLVVRQFLIDLDRVIQSRDLDHFAAGVEPRLQELAQSYETARRDVSRDHSVLVTMGPTEAVSLLDASDPPGRRELLRVLDELRELITRHRQANTMGIFEEF